MSSCFSTCCCLTARTVARSNSSPSSRVGCDGDGDVPGRAPDLGRLDDVPQVRGHDDRGDERGGGGSRPEQRGAGRYRHRAAARLECEARAGDHGRRSTELREALGGPRAAPPGRSGVGVDQRPSGERPRGDRRRREHDDDHTQGPEHQDQRVEVDTPRWLGDARDPDGHQRRCRDRAAHRHRRREERDGHHPEQPEPEPLAAPEPEGAERRVVDRVEEQLARDRLTQHEHDRQREDDTEDPERDHLGTDRPVDPRTVVRGRRDVDGLTVGQLPHRPHKALGIGAGSQRDLELLLHCEVLVALGERRRDQHLESALAALVDADLLGGHADAHDPEAHVLEPDPTVRRLRWHDDHEVGGLTDVEAPLALEDAAHEDLVLAARAREPSLDDPRATDLVERAAVEAPARGDRRTIDECVARPLGRQVEALGRRDVLDGRKLFELTSRERHLHPGAGADGEVGCVGGREHPLVRRVRASRAGRRRQHRCPAEPAEQGKRQHAAPPRPHLRAEPHPQRAHHSLRSTAAGRTRAAIRPGTAAAALASTSTAGTSTRSASADTA